FRAMNKPYQLAIAGIISSILSVGCSYILCLYWGLTGAATGTLLFEVIMALYVMPTSYRLIGISLHIRKIWKIINIKNNVNHK
ncbi:MAG: polysaccharide biosynthesis C-terminal domain-containing protein, partial [Bacteroidales bacterium]|nr:polysaccharide biosynthesis C-terminal domain-containing protein [Bacteroidales bacterium]